MAHSCRSDGFTFYAVALTSFLESAVGHYVENLQPYFGGCPEAALWLRETWLPEESEHGRVAREFLERRWPEFEWQPAYSAFLAAYAPCCDHHLLRPTPAMEALARCVTETQASMMYRAVASHTADAELKSLLTRMSRDEVRHYSYFRRLFDRFDAVEGNSFWRKARTVLSRSELVRDEDLALAFAPLNDSWRGPAPFDRLSYRDFLAQGAQVMSRHFPVEAARRMLFRPLLAGRAWERWAVALLAPVVLRQYAIES